MMENLHLSGRLYFYTQRLSLSLQFCISLHFKLAVNPLHWLISCSGKLLDRPPSDCSLLLQLAALNLSWDEILCFERLSLPANSWSLSLSTATNPIPVARAIISIPLLAWLLAALLRHLLHPLKNESSKYTGGIGIQHQPFCQPML